MTLKELQIKHSYISYGDEGIAEAFLNPALKCAKHYKRSVGFFSSGSLTVILDGIMGLVKNKGKIQLIASPRLSQADIDTIETGYELRKKTIEGAFSKDFLAAIESLKDNQLKLLLELITKDYMDIKIAVTKKNGIYHDKLGIIEDSDGNAIAFYGSPNESYSGYCDNYEKIRVSKSWIPGEDESVDDEEAEFDSLWSNQNPFVDVFDYTECAEKCVLEVSKERAAKSVDPIDLRDYQKDAIQAWVDNNYHGFYVMATGTGKTWTAIYSAKKLLEKHSAMIVICAPYKHLVKQWAEDVQKVFSDAKIILVSSENPTWDKQLKQEIIRKRLDKKTQIIVISTITSFNLARFVKVISTSEEEKLLIVDEAHRFTKRPESLKESYQYLLGLSATPYNGKTVESGKELVDFFGGEVFSLPIEAALEQGHLVPYYYHPIYVYATHEEEEQFTNYTHKIISCFKNNKLIDKDGLVRALRGRLRVISMAEEKQQQIGDILTPFLGTDHFVVYCGDGRLFDEESGADVRHIESVRNIMHRAGFRVSQFTAKENMQTRMQLVESFDQGDISALVAIRCLDEGINIPSITSALILSSNDNYREFVQRRGRILRKYKDKQKADIYDIIVLPSYDMQNWATIEFRRFYEYAKLAQNKDELMDELMDQLSPYGLVIEDIATFEFEDIEVDLDE